MIDSHCHVDFTAFDKDRDEVISRARQAGVHTIINIGCDVASSRRSIALAEAHSEFYATVGMHPHDAKNLDDSAYDELAQMTEHPRVVGVGEIGLDFYRDLSPRSVQRKAFERQLGLAVEKKLPVVIHTRESFADTLSIVRDFARDLCGGIFHCFPGSAEDAAEIIELGFVISVGGVITYKNASMATTAAAVALDKILIETDAPYLTPMPHRGTRNEPAYVALVRDQLAALHQVSPEHVESVTDQTCRKLFGLVETFGG